MVIAMLKLRRFCFGRFQCQLSRSDLLFKFCLFGFQAGKFLFFRKHGSLSTPQRASQNFWYAFAITLYGCCLALPPCATILRREYYFERLHHLHSKPNSASLDFAGA